METNRNIKNKIADTLSAMDAIESVNVSPFFKDKTMQRLFIEQEEEPIIRSWFSLKLQFAVLVCIIVLNVIAFSKLNSNNYDSNISEFAETYGLFSDSDLSLFK